ncbi:MAG: HIT domain-containing protein [Candidatus Diapherotrites archaeon]|nr:HIT domain-containing protein [Candidatus Diapherotrites archaeon]
MTECIFCKIVENKVPSYKISENKDCMSFLDIYPCTEGHVLCIPKKHYETIDEMPEEELKELIVFTQNTGKAVKKAMKVKGFNLLQSNHSDAGQVIPHVHFHIIPRKSNDGLTFENKRCEGTKEKLEETKNKIKEQM